jgi:NitT/TauT family transport system permease protein
MSMSTDQLGARATHWVKRRIPTVVAGVVLVLAWIAIATYIDNNRIFPSILATINGVAANQGTVLYKLTETFTSVIVAFLLATILGVALGLVIAEVFAIRRMAMPVLIFAYSVPHPVLAPVFIIWFIVGSPIVFLSIGGINVLAINGVTIFGAWVAFFPIFISTITGMNELEERFEHLGTVLGANRWQMVKYFRFWRALPNITSSIKATVQLSIVGVIVAEFIAASSGIGYEIVLAYKTAQLGYMFGVILIIMLGSYLFYQIVVWTLKVLTPPGSVS